MNNPATPMFEMQRTAIAQNQQFVQDAVDAQLSMFDLMADGVEANRSMTERNVEFSQSTLHAYLDAVESAMPEEAGDLDDFRAAADEGVDAWNESQAEAWDALIEAVHSSGDAYEEFADTYLEAVDASFDAFLETHEEVEAAVDETVEDVESIEIEAE